MARDWIGGKSATFTTLGASNHCDHDRADEDYYATEPAATEWLCKLEQFNHDVWEPACGQGHIAEELKKAGYNVRATDLVNRGYGEIADFLWFDVVEWHGDIVTNPPYRAAQEFVQKALDIIPEGNKVAMFLKLTFLEGKERRMFFNRHPPKRVWVASGRLKCAMNGEFDSMGSSAAAYAWFIWEKGYNGYPQLRWFN